MKIRPRFFSAIVSATCAGNKPDFCCITMTSDFDMAAVTARLATGLDATGIELSPEQVDRLVRLLAELSKWNRTYNLTAVRDPQEMVARHLLDSLSALAFVVGERVLDVGTGAGLPGIPLAVARPQQHFTLLDSIGKKQHFVTHVAGMLGLANVEAVQARVEEFIPSVLFDTVICRAFSSLTDFVSSSGRLIKPGGRLVAMKGKLPAEELAALPADWQVLETVPVSVPGLSGERHIVVLQSR